MIRRPPRSTRVRSSAASDVYKRQFDVFDHVHAFEHGLAVVLQQNRNLAFADEAGHGVAIVVAHDYFLQGHALERGDHPHTETERAMLEHIKLHDAGLMT